MTTAPTALRVRRADVRDALVRSGRTRPAAATGAEKTSRTAGAVLRAVLDHGPVARSTVARLTGLSPSSVTGLVGHLLDRGLVREAPEHAFPNGIGRPHVPLELDDTAALVVGAHVAVRHTTLALVDLRGRVVAQRRDPHRSTDAPTVLADLADHLVELLAGTSDGRVLGVGVATGGRVDSTTGTVVEHPMLGWRDVPVARTLGERLGARVGVDGHARALVHAEQLFGEHRARARSSTVQLFVGNVVEAGLATGGRVHAGPHAAAGAVAHLPADGSTEPCDCGRTGCLLAEVSERTLMRRAVAARVVGPGASVTELVDAAVAGHETAIDLFRDRARHVGRAAAILLDVLDPELLTVVEAGVGSVPGCLEVLRASVAAASTGCADPAVVVQRSSFPRQALAVSGAAVLLERLYASPLQPTT